MSTKFFSTNLVSKSQLSAPFILVEYLIIGGGAGAGGASGAAGGAGGYRCSVPGENSGGGASAEARLNLYSGTPYNITVGAGGPQNASAAGQGNPSTFHTITSLGGGFYATGGSGGGRGQGDGSPGFAGTTGQGYAGGASGGSAGGGGGGAGSAGTAGSSVGGNGGNGVASSITGVSVTRAGGGGGGGSSGGGTGGSGGGGVGGANSVIDTKGAINTGGGAGSCYAVLPNPANGGSGIVILAYPNYFRDLIVSAGLTYTRDVSSRSGFKVYSFTAGSGAVIF